MLIDRPGVGDGRDKIEFVGIHRVHLVGQGVVGVFEGAHESVEFLPFHGSSLMDSGRG